jgi:hypothetical protein
MSRVPAFLLIGLAASLSLGASLRAPPDELLTYQRRANRYEGIKPAPVSGYDIELISARVDFKEDHRLAEPLLKIKFFLEKESPVYIVVRELDYKYYYWLDKVEPPHLWQLGFENVFEWPARDVIQQLDGLTIDDLGVVVRLDKPEPGRIERIAPAILYQSKPPSTITGYLFTFRINGDAKVECSIRGKDTSERITQTFPRQPAGQPFTCRWATAAAPEGYYELSVRGKFLDVPDPIDLTAQFYHQPHVP